jgi:hypothetical protein
VTVSITMFAHSVGEVFVKVKMDVMSAMACCAALRVAAVMGRSVAVLMCGCRA